MELIVHRFKGKIISKGEDRYIYYLDQLSYENDIWIYCRQFGRYLKSKYNISIQEYYNLVMLGDINSYVKCDNPKCNCNKAWSGKLTLGYLRTCGNTECISAVESINASNGLNGFGHMHWNPELYPDYINYIKTGGEFGDVGKFHHTEFMSRGARTRFLSTGNETDIGLFYVTYTKSGKFKFGITTDLEIRYNHSSATDSYLHPRVIFKGTKLEVANLEYIIKCKLNTYSEYLDSSIEFWKLIKSILRSDQVKELSSTTIPTGSTLK